MALPMKFWFASFVGLVFFVGLSAGVIVDRQWLTRQPPPPAAQPDGPGNPGGRGPRPGGPPEVPPDRVIDDLDRVLHLTGDERQQILAILEAHRPRVQELQRDARQKFVDEQNAIHADVEKVLTPEQNALFKDMRTPPGGGPPPPPRGRGPGRRGL